MKLLFIAKHFPAQFKNLVDYFLENKEHEIQFFSEYRHQQYSSNGLKHTIVKFPRIHYKGEKSEKTALSLLRRANAFKSSLSHLKSQGFVPDVIFLETGNACAYHIFDVFPKALTIGYCEYFFNEDKAFADSYHALSDDSEDFAPLRVHNTFQLESMHNCLALFTHSKWQKELFPSAIQKKITVIPNGVNTHYFEPLDMSNPYAVKTRLEARKFFNFEDHHEIITYAAPRISSNEVIENMFTSVKNILDSRPNARLLLIAKPEDTINKEDNADECTQNFIRDAFSEYSDKVLILDNASMQVYKAALVISDLHLYTFIPSLFTETLPELLSTSCLVLAQAKPAVEEFIEDKNTGYLHSFLDPKSLAEKIDQLLNDKENNLSIRKKAREKALENYSTTTSIAMLRMMLNSYVH